MSEDIDAYLSDLPDEAVARHQAMRDTVREQGEQLPRIGAPATRALAGIGVTRMSQLAEHSERELLELHGFGPKALRLLREAGATFRNE